MIRMNWGSCGIFVQWIVFSHEKGGQPAICHSIDVEHVMQSEISQTNQDSTYDITYLWNSKDPNSLKWTVKWWFPGDREVGQDRYCLRVYTFIMSSK